MGRVTPSPIYDMKGIAMNNKIEKIAVLAGGLSHERDVSLVSGSLIANALAKKGYKVALADVFMGTEPVTENTFTSRSDYSYKVSESVPDLARLKEERGGESEIGENIIELCLAADVCFMALHGGIGENGKLQAMLEMLGVKFTGSSSEGAMLAMDKDLSKQLLRHAGVLNADWLCVSHADDYTEADYAEKVGYPCVIKPCNGGSSVGVSFAENYAELREAVEKASEYENSILVERKVCGRELTIGVIDGVALPPVEIIPKSGFYDYSNKYQSGRTEEICPAPLTEDENKRLADAALKAFDTLRLGSYARIDFIYDGKDFYCLEANTLPGMTPLSLLPQEAKAVGIEYGDLCEKLVMLAVRE